MKVSVVIPTFNRRELLSRTLPTILDQDFPAAEYEVVVVVDGSTDATAQFLQGVKTPVRLQVIEQPNGGPAKARNTGIRAARGELLLFLDDDIRCDPSLIGKHVAAHREGEDSVVFGPVLIAPESPAGLATDLARVWYEQYAARLTAAGKPRSQYDVWIYTNCSVPRSAVIAQDGYDENLRTHEDADLGIRLWQAGVRFRFDPGAPVYQIYSKSVRDLVNGDAARFGASEIVMCRKHPGYRRYARLAAILDGSPARSVFARLLCAAPQAWDPALRLPLWAVNRLRTIEPMRRAGLRLLNYRSGLMVLRSAVRELGSWELLRDRFVRRLPVLLYHHVGPPARGVRSPWTVSPASFAAQVSWLARHGYVGIASSDWAAWCLEGKPLPEKPVLITLDDGYADIAEYALPVLRRHGFRATVYLVTARIGAANTWDQARGLAPLSLMGADQIRYWAGQGIEFGAHSRTHPDLTTIGQARVREEIEGSADDLQQLLGRRPVSFAYPYGAYNEFVKNAAANSFTLAFGARPGLNGLLSDLHLLSRTAVMPGDSRFNFGCRVFSGHAPLQLLRRLAPGGSHQFFHSNEYAW